MTFRTRPRSPMGDLIDGRFVTPARVDRALECRSPADRDDLIGVYPASVQHAHEAVESARGAARAWRRASPQTRAAHVQAYAAALRARREDIALAIARAIGKPMWEARAEADLLPAKVDLTLGPGLELVAPRAFDATATERAEVRYRPLGVCAVLGPFNFPAHLPNGHLVPALVLGNTVVFKPSERAPEVGELIAICLHEAGFPAGVVNVVQGDAAVSEALVEHPDVNAVMFTGSTRVGRLILERSARDPGRMLALELGGSNAALVLDDADVAHAAREIAFAAYVTAGQRCTATARVYAHRSICDALAQRLADIARRTRVGAPWQPDVFLGPLIDEAAVARALGLARRLERQHEALVPLAPVGHIADGVRGHYLAPALYRLDPTRVAPHEPDVYEERFAPLLTVEPFDDEAQAIERANNTPYGLAASVFTADPGRFDAVADELDVGVCNLNRGTVGSSSRLPFGGTKQSGNHRAAGLFSTLYCADPIARIRVHDPPTSPTKPPGFGAD